MKKLTVFLCFCFVFSLKAHATLMDSFASEVVFIKDPQPVPNVYEGPPESMLGAPNQSHVDLDGGAATFLFSSYGDVFNFETAIPDGADLIIVEMALQGGGDRDTPTSVGYGFGNPIDTNNDGFADNTTGFGTLLDYVVLDNPSWLTDVGIFDAHLLFYDLGSTITSDLFVSISGNDFELDSIHARIPSMAVPEPASVFLIVVGLLSLVLLKKTGAHNNRG